MAPPRRRSAKRLLEARLRQVGLGALTNWWWERRQAGWTGAEIWLAARDTATYKRRFAGLDKARAAGLQINERGYVEFEQTMGAFARQHSIPLSLVKAMVPKWIGAGTSPVEIQERLEQNLAAIDTYVASNPQVQAELAAAQRFYGVAPTRGDLLAMALDPALGAREAERRLQAVRAAATAATTGFGDLTRGEAEELTGYGLSAEEEQQGFGELVDASELFGGIEHGEDDITRAEQLGATFGGDSAARRRIGQRQRRRKGGFESSSGFGGSVAGLGSAST